MYCGTLTWLPPKMVLVEMAGAEDTIYLCNFRVSVDGDWLCLKELAEGGTTSTGVAKVDSSASSSPGSPPPTGAYTHHHHHHLPYGSSPSHTLPLSEQLMLNPPESASTSEGSAEGSSPPHNPALASEGGAVGRALSVLPGLPPGLFAPYVPLSCGPSARFLLYVALALLVDTVGPGYFPICPSSLTLQYQQSSLGTVSQ